MIDWHRTVKVGTTDLAVPRIGLGTASLGNFLAPMTDTDAVAVIRRALDAGIRYIDTAPLYGHGLAEARVHRAIAGRPRAELVLSTKVGRLLREMHLAYGLTSVIATHNPRLAAACDRILRLESGKLSTDPR